MPPSGTSRSIMSLSEKARVKTQRGGKKEVGGGALIGTALSDVVQ